MPIEPADLFEHNMRAVDERARVFDWFNHALVDLYNERDRRLEEVNRREKNRLASLKERLADLGGDALYALCEKTIERAMKGFKERPTDGAYTLMAEGDLVCEITQPYESATERLGYLVRIKERPNRTPETVLQPIDGSAKVTWYGCQFIRVMLRDMEP